MVMRNHSGTDEHQPAFHVGDAGSNPAGDASTYETSAPPLTPISPQSWQERFWSKVDRRGPDACWLWCGGKRRKGYGAFHRGGLKVSAHRAAWEAASGRAVPDGCMVLHSCDQPACCNPAHLRIGNAAQNSADAVSRGRLAPQSGNANNNARLSDAQVVEMRSLRARGVRIATLASDYGVTMQTVSEIVGGKSWKTA